MTHTEEKRYKGKGVFSTLWSVTILCLTVYFATFISGRLTAAVIDGMRIGALTVLPSTFPFMIISDLYCTYGYPERIGVLGILTERVLHLPKKSVRAILLGNLAGFPIGAKIAAELYTGGGVDKENAEKLIAYSNNPSIPFVVACVGGTLFNDIKIGVFLLIIIYISTILTAIIYRGRKTYMQYSDDISNHTFSFVSSVKSAGLSAISILSFIVTFYVLISVIRMYIQNGYILSIIASIMELASAVTITSSLTMPISFKIPIVAFALGFGGISVMMQTAIFTSVCSLSLVPYLKIKLTEGLLSALLAFLTFPLFCFFL